jgi:hypothetical protein
MSPSRTSIAATLFGMVIATVGAIAIHGYELSQAQAPVVVQLERVEIVASRLPATTLAQADTARQ